MTPEPIAALPTAAPVGPPLPRLDSAYLSQVAEAVLAQRGDPFVAYQAAIRAMSSDGHSAIAGGMRHAALIFLPKQPPTPTPRPECPDVKFEQAQKFVKNAVKTNEFYKAERALDDFRKVCGSSYPPEQKLRKSLIAQRTSYISDTLAKAQSSYENGSYDDAMAAASEILDNADSGNTAALELKNKVAGAVNYMREYESLRDRGYDERMSKLQQLLKINPADPKANKDLNDLKAQKAAGDKQPPVVSDISHINPGDPSDIKIRVTIADPTGIARFSLSYRKGATMLAAKWSSQMTGHGKGAVNVTHVFSLPEDAAKKTLEVRIEAEDLKGNRSEPVDKKFELR